ncbi:MAG: DUF3108 domain-containing protein [Nitrospirales bacterium]|nr:DUF3108 domain-containing protein [Nitrospirales bacterium]
MTIFKAFQSLALSIFVVLLAFSAANAQTIPELLQYDLTWSGIKAGDAVLEVKDKGQEAQIISKATSSKFVSLFYRVEDVIVSTLRKGQFAINGGFWGTPSSYRMKLREGKHRKDKEVLFDFQGKKITYINHLEEEKASFDMNGSVLDPLSCFYYVRGVPLEVGKSVFVDIFDSKKLYSVEVQVLKKETIETPLGTFNTILIKPLMKSEGIFYRKGDILIWLTDDEKRLPVLLKTKVAVGSVKATLTGGKY